MNNSNDMNSGYVGYSMSVRAAEAYESGERPLSRWTKKEIVSEISDYLELKNDADYEEKIKLIKKIKVKTLKGSFLYESSWHHTSSYCNATSFYSIDFEKVDETTLDDLRSMLDSDKEDKDSVEEVKEFLGEIRYLEWSGTRAHPKATDKVLENVIIQEKGCFYHVFDKKRKFIMRKKKDSRGTYVVNYKLEKERKRQQRERVRHFRENSSKTAYDFWKKIKGSCEYSSSNHLYVNGRKPSRSEYESGDFFKIGEKRLFQNEREERYELEEWNGTMWISEYSV